MKEFPLDVDSIYHNRPDSTLEYYTIKSTAIIGGICKSTSDILEKILLANSFLDTFNRIYFVGEMGLAAIHALGLNPGRVERSADNKGEYAKMKEFFVRLYEKSVEKGCEIKVPIDFITAPKASLESIIAHAGKADTKPKVEEEEPVTTGAKKTTGGK